MGKKRKNNDGGGAVTLVVVAVFSAFGFIMHALSVMITGAITAVFYLFPLIALVTYLYIRKHNVEYPETPNAADYDPAEISKQISHLIIERARLIANIRNSYAIGATNGLYLTKGSGEKRFDTRSKLGRELNGKIESNEERVISTTDLIDSKRHQVSQQFPFLLWQQAFYDWKTWQDASASFIETVRIFLVAVVLCYGIALVYPDKFWTLQGVIAWQPFPSVLVSPLLVSMLVAAIAFPVRLKTHRQTVSGRLDRVALAQWSELSLKWIEPEFESLFVERFGETRAEENEHAADESVDWYVVLNVVPSASPDEIKSAYRVAVKNYHPDRVSGLGTKLQELAEHETKRLNAAYQAARTQKGF
ncbi:DnaJ family molecular chaperone [Mesorhizobium sp. M0898]|uniref:J domain-containing protein n=1 Tax=Mesorhizobium sp. M0898 TaxID=2957020 RepID=UPI003337FBE8